MKVITGAHSVKYLGGGEKVRKRGEERKRGEGKEEGRGEESERTTFPKELIVLHTILIMWLLQFKLHTKVFKVLTVG